MLEKHFQYERVAEKSPSIIQKLRASKEKYVHSCQLGQSVNAVT
jgi:purine nucleoside permease